MSKRESKRGRGRSCSSIFEALFTVWHVIVVFKRAMFTRPPIRNRSRRVVAAARAAEERVVAAAARAAEARHGGLGIRQKSIFLDEYYIRNSTNFTTKFSFFFYSTIYPFIATLIDGCGE